MESCTSKERSPFLLFRMLSILCLRIVHGDRILARHIIRIHVDWFGRRLRRKENGLFDILHSKKPITKPEPLPVSYAENGEERLSHTALKQSTCPIFQRTSVKGQRNRSRCGDNTLLGMLFAELGECLSVLGALDYESSMGLTSTELRARPGVRISSIRLASMQTFTAGSLYETTTLRLTLAIALLHASRLALRIRDPTINRETRKIRLSFLALSTWFRRSSREFIRLKRRLACHRGTKKHFSG